jgi:hypothetical protein
LSCRRSAPGELGTACQARSAGETATRELSAAAERLNITRDRLAAAIDEFCEDSVDAAALATLAFPASSWQELDHDSAELVALVRPRDLGN